MLHVILLDGDDADVHRATLELERGALGFVRVQPGLYIVDTEHDSSTWRDILAANRVSVIVLDVGGMASSAPEDPSNRMRQIITWIKRSGR